MRSRCEDGGCRLGGVLEICVYVHRDGDMVHWYACGDRGALGWGMSDASGAICGVMHWYD